MGVAETIKDNRCCFHGFRATVSRRPVTTRITKVSRVVSGECLMCDDADQPPRLTDLSSLSAENIKFRNTQFLTSEEAHYDNHHDRPRMRQRKNIWRVRNGDLRCILREFPKDRPVPEQCALWMHAIVGKHFFPDANHRTAIALLRKLLRENGIDAGEWNPERVREVRDKSHEVRNEITSVHMDTLYREDELYCVWLRFFHDVLPDRYLKE